MSEESKKTGMLDGLLGGDTKTAPEGKKSGHLEMPTKDIEKEVTDPVGEAKDVSNAAVVDPINESGLGSVAADLTEEVGGTEKSLLDKVGLGSVYDAMAGMSEDLGGSSTFGGKDVVKDIEKKEEDDDSGDAPKN